MEKKPTYSFNIIKKYGFRTEVAGQINGQQTTEVVWSEGRKQRRKKEQA